MTIYFLLLHYHLHVTKASDSIGKPTQPKPVPAHATVNIRSTNSKSLGQYLSEGQSTSGRVSWYWLFVSPLDPKRQKRQTRATLSAATYSLMNHLTAPSAAEIKSWNLLLPQLRSWAVLLSARSSQVAAGHCWARLERDWNGAGNARSAGPLDASPTWRSPFTLVFHFWACIQHTYHRWPWQLLGQL